MLDGARAALRAYTETYIRIACAFSCNRKATFIFPKGNKGNVNRKEKPFACEGMNRKLSEEKYVLSSPRAAPPSLPDPPRASRSAAGANSRRPERYPTIQSAPLRRVAREAD